MPRPKPPTALALLRGTRPDRINRNEPVPNTGEVIPPAWMMGDEVAMATWDRLAGDLAEKGVLSNWDCEQFGEYCLAVSVISLASAHLRDEGEVITEDVFYLHSKKTGTRQRRNPWGPIMKEAMDLSACRAAKFGLSPADRANVNVVQPHVRTRADDFFTS